MTNETAEALFVKKAELARALGVSTRTVDNWLARRIIPYIAVSPRMNLFDVVAVKTALKDQFGVEPVAGGR
jgi:DNA-binding transcriptional regulator YiaG